VRKRQCEIMQLTMVRAELLKDNSQASLAPEQDATRFFRSLIEEIPDLVLVLSREAAIKYANRASERILSFTPDELVGKSSFEFVHSADVNGLTAAMLAIIRRDSSIQGSFRFRCKKSGWRFFELAGSNLLDDLAVQGVVMVLRDVTDRKKTEALLESPEQYLAIIKQAEEGFWEWDLDSGKFFASASWKEMLGIRQSESANTLEDWLLRVHEDCRVGLESALLAQLEGKTNQLEYEYRIRHSDGSYRHMIARAVTLHSENGNPSRISGSQHDITGQKQAEAKLVDTLHDALTGLPTRVLFYDRYQTAVMRSRRRPQHCCAVLFVGLDRFKVVNDTLGHTLGDRVLVEVAQILRKCVRATDTICRFSGDEFAVLLDELRDNNEVSLVARRIHDHLSFPVRVFGQEVFTSVSIGIAVENSSDVSSEDLVRDADIAMRRAKQTGKGCTEVFEPGMRAKAVQQMEIETELRHAVEREEFEIWYQPIVNVQDRSLDSFEALIRWRNARRGLVSPVDFIPVAEETGLIVPIGSFVLAGTCSQLNSWRYLGKNRVTAAVNLSVRQFLEGNLVDEIFRYLDRNQLDPLQLKVEITESLLMTNVEHVEATLKQLRARGIKVCLDDFGTGYSSLSYLAKLPIDILKIDRSFVSRISNDREKDKDSTKILEMILEMASKLNIDVIAEGVETEEQLSILARLGCKKAQGYLFSKPVTAEAAGNFVASGAAAFLQAPLSA